MLVVIALLAPGGAGWVFAPVYAPLDVRALAEHAGLHERADVQAHPIIEIRIPANWLAR